MMREFADVLHDRSHLRLGHLGLRWHIAVRPMVLPRAQLGREKEGAVSMVSRILWSVPAALRPCQAAQSASKAALPSMASAERLGDLHLDCGSLRRRAWPRELPNEHAEGPVATVPRTRYLGRSLVNLMLHGSF
jgi:hypothetical protein